MSTFDRVKKISEKHGYSSLRTLAESAGLGTNAIYNWKKSEPTTKSAKAVADVLGVSVDYLLGNTNTPNVSNMPQNNFNLDLREVAEEERHEGVSAGGNPISDEDWAVIKALLAKYPRNEDN